MNQFVSFDNRFFRTVTKAVDCMILSMLFLLSCIPIVTAGAAMTAMYYTVQKAIRRNRGYVTREYWHTFRDSFKKATPIWLMLLAFSFFLVLDLIIFLRMLTAGAAYGSIYFLFAILLLFAVAWSLWLFPYMARFESGRRSSMKNAAFMSVMYLPRTLLLVLNTSFWLLLTWVFFPFPLFFITPTLHTWVQCRILEKVFFTYMSEEEKQAETEMNAEAGNVS